MKKLQKKKQPKKLKSYSFSIKDEIFNVSLFIYIGERKETEKLITKKHKIDPPLLLSEEYAGCSMELKADDGSHIFLIWVLNEDAEFLVHESFHSVCRILENRELKLNTETEELYAYYLGYIIKNIQQHLEKRHKNDNQI
jgi:hypothetical protein